MRTVDWILGHLLTAGIGVVGGFVLGVAGYAYARATRPDEENKKLDELEDAIRSVKQKSAEPEEVVKEDNNDEE